MFCTGCGDLLKNNNRFCTSCGIEVLNTKESSKKDVARALCEKCGTEIKGKNKFCTNCGNGVSALERTTESTPSGLRVEREKSKEAIETAANQGELFKVKYIIGVVILLVAILTFVRINNNSATPLFSGKLSNAEIIAKVKPAVVYVEAKDASGSGMIINSNGTILTNAHVVEGVDSVVVGLSDDTSYEGKVVGRDEEIDLAILKIEGSVFPTVKFGDSNNVKQGDEAFTLGYPFGLQAGVDFKDGTISRIINIAGINYLETSAQIVPGNSGGPLVDVHGKVVGINTATYTPNSIGGISLGETIKFAIPINVAVDNMSGLEGGRMLTISNATKCQDSYGENSDWSGELDTNGEPACTCKIGYAWSIDGNSCQGATAIDRECQDAYGAGSYSYEAAENSICKCRAGYSWNSDRTACVIISKTNDQKCKDDFGLKSEWTGQLNSQNGPVCDCISGYVWNSEQTNCIVQKTSEQICKERDGIHARYNSSDNSCICESGYSYSASSKQCVNFVQARDESCAAAYPGTSFLRVDSADGKNICDCISGYYWDNTRTACYSLSAFNQSCVNSYGQGSYSTTENGKRVCACSYGYDFNIARDSCVTTASINESCVRDVGRNSYYLGYTKDGKYMCSSPY